MHRAQLLNAAFTVRVRATRGNSNTAFTASLDAVSVIVDYTVLGTMTLTTNTNLVAKGADTFAYDQANRLVSATVAGVTETHVYDGNGVRFSRTVGAGPAIRYVSDVNTTLPITIDVRGHLDPDPKPTDCCRSLDQTSVPCDHLATGA